MRKFISLIGIAIFTNAFALLGLNSSAHAAWVNVPDSQVVEQIAPGSRDPLPANVSLLSWNIQKAEGQAQWQRDFQTLSTGKHLVLLQEGVEEPTVLKALHSTSGLGWLMARSFFMETDHQATGVITGAFESPWSFVFLRSPDREPIANTPKMSLLTTYQMQDGTRLLVVNVHAINFTVLSAFQRQMDQIAGLIKGWNERVILAGDFNTWSPNRTEYLRHITETANLKEVAFRNDSRKLVLDHVFARGCSPYGAQVHSDVNSSDHFPLTTEFLCAQ